MGSQPVLLLQPGRPVGVTVDLVKLESFAELTVKGHEVWQTDYFLPNIMQLIETNPYQPSALISFNI